jgi:small subunit ribosomal protein S1
MIGKSLPLKVIEVNPKERRLVFSARFAQKDRRQKRLKELQPGEIIQSRVVNVVDFGIFVDLDGVDGLVHKSELDYERINNPTKVFKIGDEVEVKVISVDIEKERVSLSRKALLPNPWHDLVQKYHTGELVEGIVVSVLDFGAFVEIEEGLQGLVHVSELGYLNTDDPKQAVKKRDPVLVKIMAIEPERERISLSMRRVPVSEQMEWMINLEDLEESRQLDGDLPQEEVREELEESLTEANEPESESSDNGELDSDPDQEPSAEEPEMTQEQVSSEGDDGGDDSAGNEDPAGEEQDSSEQVPDEAQDD